MGNQTSVSRQLYDLILRTAINRVELERGWAMDDFKNTPKIYMYNKWASLPNNNNIICIYNVLANLLFHYRIL